MKSNWLFVCFKFGFISNVLLFLAVQHSLANNSGALEYGEYLSSQCVTCHQLSKQSNGIPAIIGWDPESFQAVMVSYKKKERDNKVMQTIASSLSDEEIKALALYFSQVQNNKK